MSVLIDCRLAPHTVSSARETQGLGPAIWRRSNKTIASIPGITERTVKFHAPEFLSKRGVEWRIELAPWRAPIS